VELDRDIEIVFQRQGAAVEHVGVEEIRSTAGAATLGLLDER
jgi:hypothetical protein